MSTPRLIGAVCLWLMVLSVAWANPAERRLPAHRFQGWVELRSERTATSSMQIWRQRLYGLPRHVDGYQLVSYLVERTASPAAARQRVQGFVQRQRFNDYVTKGYTVDLAPWPVEGHQGVRFIVRGMQHATSSRSTAHRADLYTYAVSRDEWVIWLEVRLAISAADMDALDGAMENVAGMTMAQELVVLVHKIWSLPTLNDTVPPPTVPVIEQPALPVSTPPVVEQTPPAPTPPAEAPPAPTPPVVEQTPPAPTPPAEAPPAPTPPVVEQTPSAQVPAPQPTPVAGDDPAPEPGRWTTADGMLSFVLPEGWTVAGTAPYTFTGLPEGRLRLYPAEPYADEHELRAAFRDFATSQSEISRRGFTQQAAQLDGAVGVQVRFVNFDRRITHAYFVGKSGRLWRLDIDLPGDNRELPAAVQSLLTSMRIQ